MKKVLALALCVCMAAMLLAGCGGAGSSSAAASASGSAAAGTSASAAGALDPNIKATLTFATYDNEAMHKRRTLLHILAGIWVQTLVCIRAEKISCLGCRV